MVLCGKSADVMVWWDRDATPLAMCFDHYEERAKGRTLNEYGKKEKV
jgi:hypothetical protein